MDTRPKTIVFVGHEASRTGAPLSLLHLVRRLVGQGVPCEILLLRGGPLVHEYSKVCRTTVLGGTRPMQSFAKNPIVRFTETVLGMAERRARRFIGRVQYRACKKRWRKIGVRAVCLNAAMSSGYGRLADILNCPLIVYIHELSFGMIFSIYSDDLSNLIARDCTFVVPAPCVGRNLIDAHGVPSYRVRCIPETVEDPRTRSVVSRSQARKTLGIPDDAFVVMMAGTVDWRKGIDQFIALARILRHSLPNAHFCWIGGGRMLQTFLSRWVRHYNIPGDLVPRFHFAGERADSAPLIAAADVFTLTSREDPLPLVHIEAAMHEIPIVCFANAGGVPEWIGDAGIIVPFQDAHAMAQAVITLANDPERRANMGRIGRELMLKECVPQVTARRFMELVDELTGEMIYPPS